MLDAFIHSVVWHYMLFAQTANGEVWRIWFEGGKPLQQKLLGNEAEWAEPLRWLEVLVAERAGGEQDVVRVYEPTIPFIEPRERARKGVSFRPECSE